MREEDLHVTDDELLLHADGELHSASGGRVRAHLAFCLQCRTQLAHLENALAEFGAAHRENWKSVLPSGTSSHALLKAQLAELAVQESEKGGLHSAWMAIIEHRQALVFASVGIAVLLLLAVRLHTPREQLQATLASLSRGEVPNL